MGKAMHKTKRKIDGFSYQPGNLALGGKKLHIRVGETNLTPAALRHCHPTGGTG